MYQEKTDQELIELYGMHNKLTFQAQLNLQKELNRRNVIENTSDLENSIKKKMSEIENLEHLKDIGFEVEKIGSSLKVTRTFKAILIDIVAGFFGILFCIVGLFGIIGLIGSFFSENDFSLFAMVIDLGMIGLGILGVQFLNGIKRLIDFSGFELINTNGIIILKKRFDLKLVEIQKNVSLLDLEQNSDRLILKLDKDEVFSGNAKNIVQSMSLKELNRKLKTVANTVYN
ncbi:hypothetical protein [Algibacter sp. R77976]|uniref:hypothetical protein n=1 Tax=Algibacter sp. R77976 TaxID=3093873 RepID=UPI0037C76DB9